MQSSSGQPLSIEQKIQIGANIAFSIAFPVMVLLRRKMGYRFISQPRLLIAALIFWIAATFVSIPTETASYYSGASTAAPATGPSARIWLVFLFTFAFLVWGFVQRWLRWQDIKKGVSWHSRSRGISWFAFLPFNDSIVKRFVDPLVVFLVGLIFTLTGLQPLLGVYLIVAGVMLFVWESFDYEQSINLMLDQLDALVDSEVISANVEYYTQPNPKQRPLDETAGIPTGVAPDLQAAIDRRAARNAGLASAPVPAGLPAQPTQP